MGVALKGVTAWCLRVGALQVSSKFADASSRKKDNENTFGEKVDSLEARLRKAENQALESQVGNGGWNCPLKISNWAHLNATWPTATRYFLRESSNNLYVGGEGWACCGRISPLIAFPCFSGARTSNYQAADSGVAPPTNYHVPWQDTLIIVFTYGDLFKMYLTAAYPVLDHNA